MPAHGMTFMTYCGIHTARGAHPLPLTVWHTVELKLFKSNTPKWSALIPRCGLFLATHGMAYRGTSQPFVAFPFPFTVLVWDTVGVIHCQWARRFSINSWVCRFGMRLSYAKKLSIISGYICFLELMVWHTVEPYHSLWPSPSRSRYGIP